MDVKSARAVAAGQTDSRPFDLGRCNAPRDKAASSPIRADEWSFRLRSSASIGKR